MARLCSEVCAEVRLEKLGYLTGLIHDLGKGALDCQRRVRGESDKRVNHSSAGMRWLLEKGQAGKSSKYLAAQMAALAVGCHHGCRCDMISPLGHESWRDRISSDDAKEHYEESVRRFFADVLPEAEALELLDQAAEEAKALHQSLRRFDSDPAQREFARGFVQRLLFSALVDADWTDTACFMDGQPLPKRDCGEARAQLWAELAERAETHISALPERHPIDALRRELSERCRDAGAGVKPGIYRLCLPTGAGKTYAGLRFCLRAAQGINARHIFYFAPYKSITGQNAERIREALGIEYVLEHHSDFIADTGAEEPLYLARSSRWEGAPVVCTTMAQLLDTLFAAPRQNVRRLAALPGSVLLFDEIQALPLRHTYLFNLAVNTLAELFGCVVVLCTATQPALGGLKHPLRLSEGCDIIPDYPLLFEKLKRVRCDASRCRGGAVSIPELAELVSGLSDEHRSVLAVMNTKSGAVRLYDELKERLGGDVRIFCLTTRLCPRHRSELLCEIQALLDDGRSRVVCVSTQLIEAGVDLDFDCALRSLAGIVNAVQTAGRCHRHGGGGNGVLYLVKADEDLSYLPEIDEARIATDDLLCMMPQDTDWLGISAADKYYELFYNRSFCKSEMEYPARGAEGCRVRLADLLSENEQGVKALAANGNVPPRYLLRQAFGTAEGIFESVPDNGISVLVPYGEGRELITQLLSGETAPQLFHTLQAYTVQLGHGELKRLGGAVYTTLDGAVNVLRENYYDGHGTGVVFDPLPLEDMFQ